MRFNPDKCELLQITRTIPQYKYTAQGQVLINVNSAKNLGLNIHKTFRWDNHVNKVIQKAHNTFSFSSRNFSHCPTNIEDQCYSIFARSSLEYAFTVWSLAKNEIVSQIKELQR
jgi:hypothetical protein